MDPTAAALILYARQRQTSYRNLASRIVAANNNVTVSLLGAKTRSHSPTPPARSANRINKEHRTHICQQNISILDNPKDPI